MNSIPSFDIIKGMSFDYMHCVHLGVTRLLLKLWFTSSFHRQLWYLGNAINEINDLLCCIAPPDEMRRTPRSIKNTLKYWKELSEIAMFPPSQAAHELLRAWLLHYSPVVLQSFLPDDYYPTTC